MADRIITVTDPSVVTNDTLSGYNNYSDIDGQLGTTMTPTEATNGKTVTLSDGVIHEVTTKPVGTTNGEFTAVVSNAVTVDLTSGVIPALQTVAANLNVIQDPTFAMASDFEIEFQFDWTSWVVAKYIVDCGGTNGLDRIVLKTGTETQVILETRDDTNGPQTAATNIVSGDLLKITRVGDVVSLFVNNSLELTLTVTELTGNAQELYFGAIDAAGTGAFSGIFSLININSEAFPLSEGTGTTATGASGNVLNLLGTDPNAMWTNQP